MALNRSGFCKFGVHFESEDGKLSPGDPEREDLQAMIEDVSRCKSIGRSLLEYSRRSIPPKEDIDINAIIERSLKLIRDSKISIKKARCYEIFPKHP